VPRRRILLLALAHAVFVATACAAPPGAHAAWRRPVDGAVVAGFDYSARDPFAAGRRRGIDIAAPPGTVVRSACRGRVSFAGTVPGGELAVTVRCGALAATHVGLGRLAVRRGVRVLAGSRLGLLGARGRLRLGARSAAHRFAYVDPLALLRADRSPGAPAVPLGRAPRGPAGARPVRAAPARPAAPPPVRESPAAGARAPALPPMAWAGLVLVAAGLPLGGLVARSRPRGRRRRAGAAARPEAVAR
jgi:hypothetical protein